MKLKRREKINKPHWASIQFTIQTIMPYNLNGIQSDTSDIQHGIQN